MAYVRTITGNGIVTTKAGKVPVEFSFPVFRDEINVSNTAGTATNPGLSEIRGGRMLPVCGDLGETLTIETDLLKVTFSYADREGGIAVHEVSSK